MPQSPEKKKRTKSIQESVRPENGSPGATGKGRVFDDH